jgi:hypothetical protein
MRKIIILLVVLVTAGCVQSGPPAEPGDPTPPPEVAAAPTTTVEPGGGGVSANKLCTIFTDEEVAEVVGQVIDSGENAPEMCRIVGADYVLDITAGPGDWPEHVVARFEDKTSACPAAQQRGAVRGGSILGTWCKIDGVNYIVEVVGIDQQGDSVPVTDAQDTDPLMIKLLERIIGEHRAPGARGRREERVRNFIASSQASGAFRVGPIG